MTSASWDMNLLREKVERTHGRTQRDLLEPYLNSLAVRQGYAKYHFRRARFLLEPFLDKVEQPWEAVELVLGYRDGKRVPFEAARDEAAANYLACLMTIHTFSDNLSHVLYFALALNLDPKRRLRERDISSASVLARLEPGIPRVALSEIATGGNALHLAALSNVSKHRAVISVQYGASFESKPGTWHGMRFPEVKYEEEIFPAAWVDDFLKDEFARQSSLVTELGAYLSN